MLTDVVLKGQQIGQQNCLENFVDQLLNFVSFFIVGLTFVFH